SGQEYLLNTINIRSKDFTWSSSLNMTVARNKLIAFPDLASSPYYADSYIIGQPTTMVRLYRYAGVNPATGLYQFYAANGSVTSNPSNNDRVPVDLSPSFTGGFANSIIYKNFSLDFLFQFVRQNGESLWASYNIVPGMMVNQPINALNRWQKPGDQKPFEQFTQTTEAAYTAYGDAEDSNYAYGNRS